MWNIHIYANIGKIKYIARFCNEEEQDWKMDLKKSFNIDYHQLLASFLSVDGQWRGQWLFALL